MLVCKRIPPTGKSWINLTAVKTLPNLSAKGTLREQPMLESAWGGRGVLGGGGRGEGGRNCVHSLPRPLTIVFFFFLVVAAFTVVCEGNY